MGGDWLRAEAQGTGAWGGNFLAHTCEQQAPAGYSLLSPRTCGPIPAALPRPPGLLESNGSEAQVESQLLPCCWEVCVPQPNPDADIAPLCQDLGVPAETRLRSSVMG